MVWVNSPGTRLAVDLCLEGETQTLRVRHEGRDVVLPSPLRLTDPMVERDESPPSIIAVDRTDRTIDRSFTTTTGKRTEHTYRAQEATFHCDLSDGQPITVDIRVSDDGVAFRQRIPEPGATLTFETEASLRFPRQTTAWLSPYSPGHETTAQEIPVFDAGGEFSTPGLFDVGEDWVLFAEADVGASFVPAELRSTAQDDRVDIHHPELPVRTSGGFATPWRVLIVGDLSTVVESDLVPALVEGPRIEETDWIEPGRAAWSWWSEWDSAADPERQREYIEYAAARGWEYVLVDEGWEAEWIPELVEYASDRDVGVFLYIHWSDLYEPEERKAVLDRFVNWGVDGIKVDVMDANEPSRMQFYDRLMEAAADRRLLVNLHSSLLPTGMKVRWPHVLTYEAVKGAEHYQWSTLTPTHNTVLPFMRNVVGPMDYTPVTFSAENRNTTVGHELALSVVYESGLQHFADNVDEYAARPNAEWFLERVPATWEETRFLAGRPGVEATIARRDHDGVWYVGTITAGLDRTITVPLEFLDTHRDGTLIRDDSTGTELFRESVSLEPDGTLEIDLPADGGACLYAKPP